MSKQLKRMTLEELRPIVEDYQAHMPGWRLIWKNTLARVADPILQCITFERLADGTYRPVGFIHVLTAPKARGAMDLPKYLNARLRCISLAGHQRLKANAIEAMQREFVPSIAQALDPFAVLELYEREAIPKSPEAYSLASLNAYLGKSARALYWCSRFSELVDELGRPWEDWDKERRAFLDSLENWIREGTEELQLQEVLAQEKAKWDITW